MVKELIKEFSNQQALEIEKIDWDEYNLFLGGNNWSLNTTSSWRIIFNSQLFGNSDSEISSKLESLKGTKIVKILSFGDKDLDFSLVLDNGSEIQFFCNSFFEPWIFRIGDNFILVASYSN